MTIDLKTPEGTKIVCINTHQHVYDGTEVRTGHIYSVNKMLLHTDNRVWVRVGISWFLGDYFRLARYEPDEFGEVDDIDD